MILSLLAAALLAAAPERVAADDNDRSALREFVGNALNRDDERSKVEPPADASPAVKRWLAAHGKALEGVRRSGVLAPQPWGLAANGPAPAGGVAPLHLFVFDWHASGRLVVYGLVGGVGKAYLFDDPGKAALPSARIGNSTVFTVPKQPPDPLATVVVLELSDKPETTSLVVRPSADGRIVMHARDAVVYGRTLRYEPEPHKDTLGYWTEPRDSAAWHFEVVEPGEYAASILQGCGKGSGGSKVEFGVGEQVLKVIVEDTGGFQNFVSRDIGRYRFDKPGRYTITVKSVEKPGVAVMDLRQVILAPTVR